MKHAHCKCLLFPFFSLLTYLFTPLPTIFTPILPHLHSHTETHLIFSLTLILHQTYFQLFHTARSFSENKYQPDLTKS